MVNGSLSHSACLKGSSVRNCFVSFPHHWREFIYAHSVPTFQLESINNSILVSWGGNTHDSEEGTEEDCIYIANYLLKSNGFNEGEIVIVRQIQCPPPCSNVSMSISSITDWEELLLNIDNAQEAFLSQFRVISNDQILPLWLEGGSLVYLKIVKISSSSTQGLLQQNTEVEIIPPVEGASFTSLSVTSKKQPQRERVDKSKIYKRLWNILHTVFILLGYRNSQGILPVNEELYITLRIIPYTPIKCNSNSFTKILHHPSLVVISEKHLKYSKYAGRDYVIGRITKLKNFVKNSEDSQTPFNKSQTTAYDTMFVVIVVWKKFKQLISDQPLADTSCMDMIMKHRTCIVSDSLRRMLSLKANSVVILDTLDCCIQNTFQVDASPLVTLKQNREISSIIEALLRNICSSVPVILNKISILSLPVDKETIDVLLSIRNNETVYIDKLSAHLLSVNMISWPDKLPFIQKSLDEIDNVTSLNAEEKLVFNEDIKRTLLKYVLIDLNMESKHPASISQFTLVQGSKGSGKSVLVNSLVGILSQKPYYVHCEIVNLKLLKGKKVEKIEKLLMRVVREALYHQPSLVVLEDLDFLTPAQSEIEDEKGPLHDYINHLAFMVKGLLNQIVESTKFNVFDIHSNNPNKNFVAVVSTCCSRDAIHPLLSTPKGRHTFSRSLQISPLQGHERLELLKTLLHQHYISYLIKTKSNESIIRGESDLFVTNFDTDAAILQLESLSPIDIKNLSLRIFLAAQNRWKQRSKLNEFGFKDVDRKLSQILWEDFYYTDQDIKDALDGFVSLASKALKLPTKNENKKCIGGMRCARDALEEMILWPAKFPSLFAQTSLRLRSGILLYGPPGCGKTLLANSFAASSNINFITVKGPELLSKYIGQSEKAVRETFERAQSAKPCILFFDEFESIAPRRGHDNTGVTDRVVNQLLTQMDGVEGLLEVYILAATSRPDLIDPALLRPGRLDKGVYCPIPDQEDREDILSVLSKELCMEKNIDFKDLAFKTYGFTGADLQSLLSTAQVKAVQEFLGGTLYEGVVDAGESIGVKNLLGSDIENFVNILFDDESVERSSVNFTNIKSSDSSNSISHTDDINNYTNYKNGKSISKNMTGQTRETSKTGSDVIYVKKRHIYESLKDVRPSINENERKKYEILHQLFTKSKEKVFGQVIPGKRETMA